MPKLEGLPVEEGVVESPFSTVPLTGLLGQPLVKQPSSWNTYFIVSTPYRDGINQFHPDEMVAPIFGPNTPFWETSLG